MKKTLAKALLAIVMDKKARTKLEETKSTLSRHSLKPGRYGPQRKKDLQIDRNLHNKSEIPLPLTDQQKIRASLISNAIKIYRSKRYIVEQLPKEQRDKLMFMALKLFNKTQKESEPD